MEQDEDVQNPTRMHAVAEKVLLQKCKPHAIAYCPTMDLVAVATESDVLQVYRLNGQRVMGVSYESNHFSIAWLRWKPNGQLLAIACTDHVIRLMSAFSGKTVHQLPTLSSTPDATISCLAWGINFTNSRTVQQQLADAGVTVSLDDLLGSNAQLPNLLKPKADLPRELALVDVEATLPKLSSLPPTGRDDDVFSTRMSIDAIFHAPNGISQNDSVDLLLTGFDNGMIHLRIFDCFEIGAINLASSLPGQPRSCSILHHAFHPLTSTHTLVVQSDSRSPRPEGGLHVLTLDLNFIPQTAPYYLPTLATKSTQLQNLLRYLVQAQTQLAFELKTAFDLPSKYLRNIDETLREQTPGADFVTAAYHLLVTGECVPQLREWLVDEVGERGVKRWEKSILGGLETMRRLVHECILPALERCLVVLSRLDGLSRFHKAARVLGLDPLALGAARDSVDRLNLLSNELLKAVGKEIQAFAAFIHWLKLEVEVQGLEVGSERAEEAREGGDEIQYRMVLDYISGPMKRSATMDYLRTGGNGNGSEKGFDWQDKDLELSFVRGEKQAKLGTPGSGKVPKLDDWILRLRGQCEKIFGQIAETLRKSILHSPVSIIPTTCDPDVLDVSMAPNSTSEDIFDIRIAAKQRNPEGALSFIWLQGRRNGSSLNNIRQLTSTTLKLPAAETVRDIKFVSDQELMVVASSKNEGHIYSQQLHRVTNEWHTRHTFDGQVAGGSRPAKLEVNGRKGRRVVCVLDEGGTSYTVFDLDHAGGNDHVPVEEGEENEDEIMTG